MKITPRFRIMAATCLLCFMAVSSVSAWEKRDYAMLAGGSLSLGVIAIGLIKSIHTQKDDSEKKTPEKIKVEGDLNPNEKNYILRFSMRF